MNRAIRIVTYTYLALFGLSIGVVVTGCTKYSHEPMCTCQCNENNSTFECGGVIHQQEIELQ